MDCKLVKLEVVSQFFVYIISSEKERNALGKMVNIHCSFNLSKGIFVTFFGTKKHIFLNIQIFNQIFFHP